MNSVEDQIRAATRAQASEMREVRPLRLTPARDDDVLGPARSIPTARAARRLRPWLAPVASAAAVVALAISVVAVRSHSNGPVDPTSAPPAAAAAAAPRYYVAVTPLGGKGTADGLAVADTSTGKTVATVRPPAGRTFTSVSAAADDRTFVVYTMPASGSRAQAGTWYELRLRPGAASPARLSRLRVPPLASVLSMAVSESGSELAVVIADPEGQPKSLTIYSVTTGRSLRSWPHGLFGFNSETWQKGMQTPELTWIDGDRDIAFPATSVFQQNKNSAAIWTAQIWHLNLGRSGGNLIADSGLVWSMNVPVDSTSAQRCTPFSTPMLSADGKTVVCPSTSASLAQTGAISYRQTTNTAPRWTVAWLAFSVSAPGTARTLYSTTVPAGVGVALQTAWTNASGTSALVEWGPLSSGTALSALHFGVASHGALTRYASPRVIGTNVNFFLPSVSW
jgi:hypothetical protein